MEITNSINLCFTDLNLMNRIAEDELCEYDSCENMYPFLIAILNYKYDDDLSEQAFLGSGVLITYKWALTSSTTVMEYMDDISKIQVRGISQYWSRDGVLSDVKEIVLAELGRKTIAALHLVTLLSNDITFPKISFERSYTNSAVYQIYGWNVNYNLALRLRKKHVSSIKIFVTAFNNDICPEITGEKTFCARPLYSSVYQPCYYETGFIMIDKFNTLLGIKSEEICRKDQSIHIYHNILDYADWIKNVTHIHV